MTSEEFSLHLELELMRNRPPERELSPDERELQELFGG